MTSYKSKEIVERISRMITESIPIAAEGMGIRLVSLDPQRSEIHCPLPPNANDKGTAFAGSIYSSLVLSGWSLAMANAFTEGFDSPWAAVARSETRYHRPITTDFRVVAIVDAMEFIDSRRRLRMTARAYPITQESPDDPRPAATLTAEYIFAGK